MADMGWNDWLTLVAILGGPMIGIWVTRFIDKSNEEAKRRFDLFATLTRTRGLELTQEHVAAINMVPILFNKDEKVISAWAKLMDHLNNPSWNSEDEKVRIGVIQNTNNCRRDLLKVIADKVGKPLPDGEAYSKGYSPVGWDNDSTYQHQVRHLVLDVLSGKRAISTITGTYQLPPIISEDPDAKSGS